MCYNCGCHIPQDDMGNPDNITEHTLEHLAQDLGKQLPDLKQELMAYLSANQPTNPTYEQLFTKAATAWGQTVEEAKKNALELLQQTAKKA